MENTQINPFVRQAISYPSCDILRQWCRCYDCRLFYFKNGSGFIFINDTKYAITDGTLIYLPMKSEYRFELGPQTQIFVLNFDFVSDYSYIKDTIVVARDNSFDESKAPYYDLPHGFDSIIVHNSPQFFELFKRCTDEFRKNPPHYRDMASAYTKNILIELLREIDTSGVYYIASTVLSFVKENYRNPLLSNADIARHFGYHPYYISRLVKEATSYSLRQYIIHHRLRMAKMLLKTTTMEISEIAADCGFQSTTYFNKQFKVHNGVSPTLYRKIHINM